MEPLPDSSQANFDLIGCEQLEQSGRKNGMCAENTLTCATRTSLRLKRPPAFYETIGQKSLKTKRRRRSSSATVKVLSEDCHHQSALSKPYARHNECFIMFRLLTSSKIKK